jgi:cell division protein FtsI (penicillin-binding protein 3)
MDAFQPGSIFKPITLAIALRANEIRARQGLNPIFYPEEKMATDKGNFPGRPFPLKDGRKHNFLNINMAVQKSSNIYVANLVDKMIKIFGDKWYKYQLEEVFGFGKKTNIELPSESLGMVPTPGKTYPNGKLEWSLPTPYSLAIGHNILVNSMQMIRAYSIIANRGKDVVPTLVRKIIKTKPDGTEELLYERKQIPDRQILSAQSCETLIKAMKYTTKLGATARLGDIMGYTQAGKSGTSEKVIDGKYSRKHYFASFIGFTPVKKPRFILMVVIDEPKLDYMPGFGKTYHGGVSAALVFREISRRSLQFLGVVPDDPYGYPYGDSRRNPQKADMYQEVKDLLELYKKWNQ